MTATAIRFAERLAFTLAAPLLALLAACSGAVGGNPVVTDPSQITILPGTGTTLYSGMPTTFSISGGTGSYIVTSSNQSVLPVPDSPRPTFTVVPNNVPADTTVTLSVRDTGSTPVVTATLTVKPGTVNNDILVTPSSTQPAGCPAGTLCSGGDAFVSVVLSQGGIALAGRVVRFDAVSGDVAFIVSASGTSPEILASSTTAVTDGSGVATARIRARAEASNQTAVIQATDVATGAFRRVAVTIAQSTGSSPGFFASPSSYTFQGPTPGQCASITTTPNLAATFFIFGGLPPYDITSPASGLIIDRQSVSSSGGSFTVRPGGVCMTDVPITIRDASGHTATVTVSNVVGTTPTPALSVAPSSVTLTSCSSYAAVTASGGTGNYVASVASDGVYAIPFPGANNQFQIGRFQSTPAQTSPQLVGISDGVTNATVTVNLTGQALGPCPPGPFSASPTTVTLSSCTGTATVTLSGGTGRYSASTNNSGIRATLSASGNAISIGRNSGPQTAGAVVTASDGAATPININVTDTAGLCP